VSALDLRTYVSLTTLRVPHLPTEDLADQRARELDRFRDVLLQLTRSGPSASAPSSSGVTFASFEFGGASSKSHAESNRYSCSGVTRRSRLLCSAWRQDGEKGLPLLPVVPSPN